MRDDDGDGEESGRAIVRLINMATNSTAGEISPRLLKAIKSTVRSSDADLRAAARSLLDLMKRPHSHVRYLTILIVDELFMRSKLFRSLVVADMDKLLSLGVGFRRDAPLPPPSSSASRLREKAIELLEKWNDAFGMHYRQLRLGYHYLKHTLKFQFPNLQEAAARQQQERREREVRTQDILRTKFENLTEKLPSLRAEVRSAVDEIQECIDIVSVRDDAEEFDATAPIDVDGEEEEFRTQELRQIRVSAMKESMKIRENSENRPIFDALRELLKLLLSRHLPSVQEWISVLIRVDLDDISFRDAALKELIDTRNLIQSVKNRCSALGCVLNESSIQKEDDDDDIWEEGKIELFKPDNSDVRERPAEKSVDLPSSSKHRTAAKDDHKPSDNSREKLLAEAPVMTWGPFLDNWGSNQDVLANQRGLELEGHWGRVDYDAVIPAEKIAELSVHRTVYKEEPAEIRPCLAPLKKGGLCQRRDLRVCPFHGPIVPRDVEGNPIESTCNEEETETSIRTNEQKDELPADDESLCFRGTGSKELPKQSVKNAKERGKRLLKLVKSAKVPYDEGENETETSIEVTNQEGDLLVADKYPDLGDQTIEKLAKQAVVNVRENDMKALKQAKRAKIREHNEFMLRDAAMTSTSYSESLQEQRDASFDNHSHATTKKPTLASMLKKKVTAKTRIAQKLLNTRVTDSASKQLVQTQESKYREAFPNQW